MTSRSGPSSTSAEVLDAVVREGWGRLVARVVARTRRLDLAEDAAAHAVERAAARWPVDGVPDNPMAWLTTVAQRHVVGRLRAEAVAGRKAPLLAVRPAWEPPAADGDAAIDEQLHLVLLCCHPALSQDCRSALALRLVIGTTTEQIARLFLVPVPTMAARLTRAKRKIVLAGIPLGRPVADELDARLDEVCRTIYLAFTAGYTPGAGPDLLRADLAGDAVRLAMILHDLVPDAPQVRALLALVLLQHSRRDARQVDGRLVTLDEQDRTRWRHDEIRAGLELVDGVPPAEGYPEELRLQALIAAEHARAANAAATDWAAIARRYAELESLTGSPVVRLNRAVAVGESDGPGAGLALLEGLDERLPRGHAVAAVRATLAERAGDVALARAAYAVAVERCTNDVERAHLAARLAALAPLRRV